jgi:NIMA (never in mitosis gene a)-related kinase
MSPEMLRDQGYSFKSDIFSLGCVLFNLITAFYLFDDQNLDEKIMKNKLCDISITDYYLRDTSTECKTLLYKLLCDDPDQRP